MPLSPKLVALVSGARRSPVFVKPVFRVPLREEFACISLAQQSEAINRVQRELDRLEVGVRSDQIVTSCRGRAASLRNIRARQERLNALATSYGFCHEWRKHVRIQAVTEPL
ncbi:hypothetical protein [Martelella mangrovi]|uniref:Uncharacterized protein n=1 Tax=Martelella mangrovi TaxID=1397477 RepID=A0ABV2IGS7_9HYPH